MCLSYSKTIDNASEAFSSGGGTVFAIAQNPFDVSLAERAQSNFNFPNVFTLLWAYDLPFGHGQAGLLGHLMGGWQINGTYRYTSGQPYALEQNAQPGSLCDLPILPAAGSMLAGRSCRMLVRLSVRSVSARIPALRIAG